MVRSQSPARLAWQFERKGVVILSHDAATEDDLMLAALEAGAEDIADLGDTWRVTTAPTDVRTGAAHARGGREQVSPSDDLTMLPSTTVELDEAGKAKSVLRVINTLEEHDDVQNVYANFDIPDQILTTISV